MERLTDELPMGSYKAKNIYLEPNRNEQECIYKLGQLEDIEEELGIEITELYKKFKEVNETMKKNGTSTHKVWFRLFGKTWALTKEELQ